MPGGVFVSLSGPAGLKVPVIGGDRHLQARVNKEPSPVLIFPFKFYISPSLKCTLVCKWVIPTPHTHTHCQQLVQAAQVLAGCLSLGTLKHQSLMRGADEW